MFSYFLLSSFGLWAVSNFAVWIGSRAKTKVAIIGISQPGLCDETGKSAAIV